ncbi:MAG: hypothetical protein E7641_04180 [Ruminococcaceae bacterium]|nr:hypothetical protein [Oscillospiraceae bacterium]
MKRLFSATLAVIMLLSCFVITASATTPLDIRYLESKGQEHIYLGGETATAPTVDGSISSGEYPTSQTATLGGCPENVIKNVKHYFSYNAEKIYLAVEMTEENCVYGTSAYYFCLGFPTAGGFADGASGLRVQLVINDANRVTPTVHYVDYHNGSRAVQMNVTLFNVVSASAAKRDNSSKKTTYEIEIDIENLKYESGIIFNEVATFYTYAISGGSTYYYRLSLDDATKAGVNAAYPDHTIKDYAYAPHVLHFAANEDKVNDAKIETLNAAAVKLYDRETFGIRFATRIDKTYLESLISANGKDKVRLGTIIVPKEKLEAAGGVFTAEAIGEIAENEGTDIAANLDAPFLEAGDSLVFTGGFRKVADKAADYVAIGYIKAGETVEYSPVYAERSVSGVAFAALRDLSATASEEYATAVNISSGAKEMKSVAEGVFEAYSSYTKAQIEELYVLASGYNCARLNYFWDVLPKAEGEVRVGCSNVYFHNIYKNLPNGSKADKEAMLGRNLASIVEMDADVVLLQEVSEGILTSGNTIRDYRLQTYLYPQLRAAGYTLVDVEIGAFPNGTSSANFKGINYTPIWYNAETMTLEACGHKYFDSVKTNPDGGLSSSKSYTWALFTQKSTGKQFAAISTHYTWHSSEEMGLLLRNKDAKEVMDMVKEIETKYNVPVIVMGDFNSRVGTPAYETMCSGNLANARTLADTVVNAVYSSSHTYSKDEMYLPTFGNPIDHAFASKSGLNITKHQNHVTNKAIAATDHVPLSIDFTIE